jgi:hypothetical protein
MAFSSSFASSPCASDRGGNKIEVPCWLGGRLVEVF